MDEINLNDLPELPFELILSYLSLEDCIKARAVSRRWYYLISRFRASSLCYSSRPIGFVYGGIRLISGALAQNFICSPGFEKFFRTLGQSILSNLKKLRLCDLNAEDGSTLAQALNSFGRLEELDIIRLDYLHGGNTKIVLKLNLPMLKSIRLEEVLGIEWLNLNAPRLLNVILLKSNQHLQLDHPGSVERLLTDELHKMNIDEMKNLKCLQTNSFATSSTLLSTLEHLNEIHLFDRNDVVEIFQQMVRYFRSKLKVYLRGLRLYDAHDPAIRSLCKYSHEVNFGCLIENAESSRLADEIPWIAASYSEERICARAISVLNRFSDLKKIIVQNLHRTSSDIERFLNLLKNVRCISELEFCDFQSQDLFDRLPDYCANLQSLTIRKRGLKSFKFLNKLENLMALKVDNFLNLPVMGQGVQSFWTVEMACSVSYSVRFQVLVGEKNVTFFNRKDAIQFIIENSP